MARRVVRSKQGKERQKKRRRVIFIVALIFIALSIWGLSELSYVDSLTIREIKIYGASNVEKDSVEKIVRDKISGNHLFIFPKRNSFLYPKKEIKHDILDNFDRISDVEIKRENLKALAVKILEREEEGVWCSGSPEEGTDAEPCYYLDKEGIRFARAPQIKGSILFTYYGGVKTGRAQGTRYLEKDTFDSVLNFRVALEELGLSAVSYTHHRTGGGTFELSSSGRVSGILNVDFDEVGAERSADNLRVILENDVFNSNLSGGKISLEYIDLRYNDRVYYK